jgi:CNT family concentrative nucleoside transporter
MSIYNAVSFVGLFVLMGVAWVFSANRRRMNWRVILWGTALQLAFAALVLALPAGRQALVHVNSLVVKVLGAAAAGTEFVFGRLAIPVGTTNARGETSLGLILAFQAFPAIVFFSALMAILYFYRIMPVIIRGFAWVFTRLMRVSGAESLCTASNIFVGVESGLTIRPYLQRMTSSELCTALTAGMATVASNVLVIYYNSLGKMFPNIVGHLISASLLSAPAALVMSKILVPETETPETLGVQVKVAQERERSVFEAVINGSNAGLQLIFGIVALLLAGLGLVALVDMVLGGVGWRVNHWAGWNLDWSLKGFLGYVFYPVTAVIGVPLEDVKVVSKIIGERTVLTEVPAYYDLAAAMAAGQIHNPRSVVLTTYALCGFAHVASLAIFVGGFAALAPSRAADLAKVSLRALLAATLACLMTACVAGVFPIRETILLGKVGG